MILMLSQNDSKAGMTIRFWKAFVMNTMFSLRTALKVFGSSRRFSKDGKVEKFFNMPTMFFRRGSDGRIPMRASSFYKRRFMMKRFIPEFERKNLISVLISVFDTRVSSNISLAPKFIFTVVLEMSFFKPTNCKWAYMWWEMGTLI